MRIGTRRSALALAQARWVAERLGPGTEVVEVSTPGDRAGALNDKSRWVSELERALLEGRIDIAVHSAKDVPTELPDGLELVAIPQRAEARDVICGAPSLAGLASGCRVGTSSLRRAAQVRAVRDDVEVRDLRGNVDTRLRKLAAGEVDALILAAAGLERLGRADEAGGIIDEFVAAAGWPSRPAQGRSRPSGSPPSATPRRPRASPPSASSSMRWAPHATRRLAPMRWRGPAAASPSPRGWASPTARPGCATRSPRTPPRWGWPAPSGCWPRAPRSCCASLRPR
jgi:Porphobilinogen deaminase, dipyromethane cofactor binding domain